MADTDRFEIEEDFAFLGRTFGEYRAMFDLDPAALVGQRVLDCPGGPSAFAAVAGELGADVVAVDPMYESPREVLAERCEATVDRTVAQLTEKHGMFDWEYYGDVATRGRCLRSASERFLADYRQEPGRYATAALPDLPFETDAFALSLSGNFLFLYDDRLDEAFHVASLRELARVSAGEVRVFTIASLSGDRSVYVDPVVEQLRADGLTATTVEVPYEFQPEATEMLVLRDVAGFDPCS